MLGCHRLQAQKMPRLNLAAVFSVFSLRNSSLHFTIAFRPVLSVTSCCTAVQPFVQQLWSCTTRTPRNAAVLPGDKECLYPSCGASAEAELLLLPSELGSGGGGTPGGEDGSSWAPSPLQPVGQHSRLRRLDWLVVEL